MDISLHRQLALHLIKNIIPSDVLDMEPAEKERWILERVLAYGDATRELIQRRLLWTGYRPNLPATDLDPNAEPGLLIDVHGMHATDLGWAVIGHIWSELRRE